MTTAEKDVFVPITFVYMGQRATVDGKRSVAIGLLDKEGKLEVVRHYAASKGAYRSIGYLYVGAEFSKSQALGMSTAKMSTRWHNPGDIAEWQAKDFAARAEMASLKIEADAKKDNVVDKWMTTLRTQYNSMMDRGDHAGCDALERAVLSSLRRRIRKDEIK